MIAGSSVIKSLPQIMGKMTSESKIQLCLARFIVTLIDLSASAIGRFPGIQRMHWIIQSYDSLMPGIEQR
jgi:hypothetical protein